MNDAKFIVDKIETRTLGAEAITLRLRGLTAGDQPTGPVWSPVYAIALEDVPKLVHALNAAVSHATGGNPPPAAKPH